MRTHAEEYHQGRRCNCAEQKKIDETRTSKAEEFCKKNFYQGLNKDFKLDITGEELFNLMEAYHQSRINSLDVSDIETEDSLLNTDEMSYSPFEWFWNKLKTAFNNQIIIRMTATTSAI